MPLNQNAMKEREEREESKSGSGMGFEKGDNPIRILPPNKDWFEKDIDRIDYKQWIHFNAGPEGSPPALCLRDDTKGTRCPLCSLAKKIKADSHLEKVYKAIVAKPQYWMNVFDLKHPEKGIQQRRFGPKVRDPIHQTAGDRSYGDILNPVSGRTFIVNLTPGNEHPSKYNQYSVAPEGSPSSVKDMLPAKWGAELEKLQGELLKPVTQDEMKRICKEIEDTVIAEALGQEQKATNTQDAGTKATPPNNATTRPAQGGTPADTDRTPADAGPPPADTKPPDQVPKADGKPSCFGEEYDPGNPKCMSCGDRPNCVTAFCGG